MKLTTAQLNVILSNPAMRKRNPHPDQGVGQCAVVQKQQDAVKGKAHHRPQKAAVDGSVCVPHQVSILFKISDKRLRDLDGMTTTIMDCLVRANKEMNHPDLPQDDNRFQVNYGTIACVDCDKGDEGAIVVIRKNVPVNW